MDGAFEDWFEATLRSSARGGRRLAQSPPSRHRCLLIKMTRARIAARSAEQIEPTDALLAGKVQRKVSNGIAGLAAAGSSRHRQKTRQFLPAQASCRDPGTRLELRSHRRSSNANSLCSRNSAGSPEICATFQRDLSSSPPTPAMQSGLRRLSHVPVAVLALAPTRLISLLMR